MNWAGLAALLAVPAAFIPLITAASDRGSTWRKVERITKLRESLQAGVPEDVLAESIQRQLLTQIHLRETASAKELHLRRLGYVVILTYAVGALGVNVLIDFPELPTEAAKIIGKASGAAAGIFLVALAEALIVVGIDRWKHRRQK